MRTMKLRTNMLAVLAVLLTPFVGSAQESHGAGGGADLFSINWGLSVWTVIIFITLLLLLWRFAWGPILSAVEAREKGIQGALDEARKRQQEAEKLLEEHKAQLADARRQAQEIMAEGREAGDRLRKEMETRAREESESILERARAEIQREKEAAVDDLRRESVDLALAAASKLLHSKLDGEQDRKLVMEYVNGLSSRTPGAEA
ncbi:MAG: F0F1 ATP synthase subunit B [Gemmatimonadota bacterium]